MQDEASARRNSFRSRTEASLPRPRQWTEAERERSLVRCEAEGLPAQETPAEAEERDRTRPLPPSQLPD